uniref:ZP domain-containing protein n=1 Tax=Heterorhabditis bacteriophora TaxID=37862 RepID=A0A1I7WH63_HETBA
MFDIVIFLENSACNDQPKNSVVECSYNIY